MCFFLVPDMTQLCVLGNYSASFPQENSLPVKHEVEVTLAMWQCCFAALLFNVDASNSISSIGPFIWVHVHWGSNPGFNPRPYFHVHLKGVDFDESLLEIWMSKMPVMWLFIVSISLKIVSKEFNEWNNGYISCGLQISRSSMRWHCWTPTRVVSRSWRR